MNTIRALERERKKFEEQEIGVYPAGERKWSSRLAKGEKNIMEASPVGRLMGLMARFASSDPFGMGETPVQLFFNRIAHDYRRPWQKRGANSSPKPLKIRISRVIHIRS